MRYFAPKIVLLSFMMFVLGVTTSYAAPSCHGREVVGRESSATSWYSARSNARAKWVSQVNRDVGAQWNNWSFADRRGYMCWEKGIEKICKAAATPCNGRMKSVSLFPQQKNNANNATDKRPSEYDNSSEDRDGDRSRRARQNQKRDLQNERRYDKSEATRSASRANYFNQTLADVSDVQKTCNGRSTRISGKLLYDLEDAKRSASTLWSEYVSITKGQSWSQWQDAKRREIKCVPDGLKVKCEVSAIACIVSDKSNKSRHVNGRKRGSDGRIALPIQRPDFNSFAYDDTVSRDPGEYGDGNVDEAERSVELPEKRDGFSLPWLSKPPAARPEPEDEEGGPFGSNRTEKEFDISRVEKDDFGWGAAAKNNQRRFNKQGSVAPALPVKRPRYKMAARNTGQNYNDDREGGRGYYQEDYQNDQLKRSGFSGLTLPQERPKKRDFSAPRFPQKSIKNRRFSQNFNTDDDEEEDSFGGGGSAKPKAKRNKKEKNWNFDSEERRGVSPSRNRLREREKSRKKDVNEKSSWGLDSESEDESRPKKRKRESRKSFRGRNLDINVKQRRSERSQKRRQRRPKASNFKREQNRSDSRQKRAGRDWNSDRDEGGRQNQRNRRAKKIRNNAKTIGGWAADDEGENRSVVRRTGEKGVNSFDGRKFRGRKMGALGQKDSKVNYLSNSGVMTRANTFYGCKEEEVASWGKAQPTKPQARQSAIKSWQKVIYHKLGKNWSDWMKAGSSRVQCGTQNGMRKCVAIGNPCGEVALKKADDFAGTARCRIYALKYRGDSHKDMEQAKQNAMNVWEKKVSKKYGTKWSDWFRSMEHGMTCKKRRGKTSCLASAIPCSL